MSTPLVPAAPGARPVAHRRVGSGRGGVPRALGALLRPAPPTPPPPAPQQLRRSALSARNRPPGQAITPGSTRSFFKKLDLVVFFQALWHCGRGRALVYIVCVLTRRRLVLQGKAVWFYTASCT